MPTTEAGRAPDTLKGHALVNRLSATPARRKANADVDWSAWVAAIEAEAAAKATAALRAQLAARVRELHQQMRDHLGAAPDEYVLLDPAAVLAVIEEKP